MKTFVTCVASIASALAFGTDTAAHAAHAGGEHVLPVEKTEHIGRLTNPNKATANVIMADEDSSGLGDYPHMEVLDRLKAAYNKPADIPALIDLFADNDDIEWCDPWPRCVKGKAAIEKFLEELAGSLVDVHSLFDVYKNPKAQFFIGNGGSVYASSVMMSIKQTEEATAAAQKEFGNDRPLTCIVASPQHFQWFFEVPEEGGEATTKITDMRVFYDEGNRFGQAQHCGRPEISMAQGYAPQETVDKLTNIFAELSEVNFMNVQGDDNVQTWIDLFTDNPEQVDDIELCAFYPYCFYGANATESLWTWQATDGEFESLFLASGSTTNLAPQSFNPKQPNFRPLWVSGNTGSALTIFGNTDYGCLESHHQFMTFTLADDSDRLQAIQILSSPPEYSMNLNECHAEGHQYNKP